METRDDALRVAGHLDDDDTDSLIIDRRLLPFAAPRDQQHPRTEAVGPARTRSDIEASLESSGLVSSDPRLHALNTFLKGHVGSDIIQHAALDSAIGGDNSTLLGCALKGELVIPDFADFCARLETIYEDVRQNTGGEVAFYIPQLARVAQDKFAMAVCTVDGQQFSIGDTEDQYCVQSTCKPINYAIALDQIGVDAVHDHVGREPSGRSFNELTLNPKGLPHNPMINAGAIMCASLVSPDLSAADRFGTVVDTWRRLTGNRSVGFDNAVFLSERETADRNFALAYFMRENGAFAPNTDLMATLDLYLQCCSITVDAPQMAMIAATFANGGICPLTNDRAFESSTVKNCLSLMASCGMYDFSGEYAFTVGLPAKSGVSGALFITIPGVCGIAISSPRLDALGNSVRGVAFSRRLTETFAFHTFSDLLSDGIKANPRRSATESSIDAAMHICAAAAKGDLAELGRLLARGVDVDRADYEGRTALHLAASEGKIATVQFLIEHGANPTAVDRWGNTPLKRRQARRSCRRRQLAHRTVTWPATPSVGRRVTAVSAIASP